MRGSLADPLSGFSRRYLLFRRNNAIKKQQIRHAPRILIDTINPTNTGAFGSSIGDSEAEAEAEEDADSFVCEADRDSDCVKFSAIDRDSDALWVIDVEFEGKGLLALGGADSVIDKEELLSLLDADSDCDKLVLSEIDADINGWLTLGADSDIDKEELTIFLERDSDND